MLISVISDVLLLRGFSTGIQILAKGLLVLVNGSPMPNELVGIARPVNPGNYKVSAEASGMKAAPQVVDLVEGANKTIDLTLKK